MPLSVYVLYHKNYTDGKDTYIDIYHLLCRNPERPLTDGVDIPVFLRTGGNDQNIPDINLNQSCKNAIIILVDEQMYCCPYWTIYINNLLDKIDSNTQIIPVSLFKYSYDINERITKIQFISLKSFSIKESWNEFKIRIFDSLIRFITNKQTEKLKLFISHSKKDVDGLGEMKAKELRNYLRTDTKLDSFFDANDILDGYDFEKQITNNVEKSLLIILKTNTYSEREWCRIEALAGKRSKVPTIAVSLINGSVKRNFPYLGNTPLIRYENNWEDIICLLLRTALDQYYQEQLLNEISKISNKDNYCILPFAPELLSFCLIDKNKNILYPEPPLGSEEINFLKTFDNKVTFITPMQIHSELSKGLKGKYIAISISESDDIIKYGGDDTLLKDITIELSRHILISGGKLVYGGDLRKQGFTELFKDLSFQYGQLEKSDRNIKYFTNYFAWPIHLELTKSYESEFEYSRVSVVKVDAPCECPPDIVASFISPTTPENLFIWAKSLTKMREEIVNNTDAHIILGGKTSGFKGKYAGILEEFMLTKSKRKPIFLLGGFGGVSKAIVEIINKQNTDYLRNEANLNSLYINFVNYYNSKDNNDPINYQSIYEDISKMEISYLNNGLSDDENLILFNSTNVLEIVSLILKGLNNIFK